MNRRVLKITRTGFASIYACESGDQRPENEFIKYLCQPHGYNYKIREVDMLANTNWLLEKHDSYYYPWLCSKIANYEFTPEEFNLLWSCGKEV